MEILLIIMLAPLFVWLGFALLTAIGTAIVSLMESKTPWIILGGLVLLAVVFLH